MKRQNGKSTARLLEALAVALQGEEVEFWTDTFAICKYQMRKLAEFASNARIPYVIDGMSFKVNSPFVRNNGEIRFMSYNYVNSDSYRGSKYEPEKVHVVKD
jgi:hypothetical protein